MRRKIFFMSLFICLIFGGEVPAQDQAPGNPSNEALQVFIRAGVAYKDGKYQDAVADYESIIKGGKESGPLYYNLGNSYLKQKSLGMAVLNYERARRLLPRDSDLKANYRYALSLTRKSSGTAAAGQSFWRRALTEHIQFYTLDEMAVILFVLAVMAGLIYLLSLHFSWPKRQTRTSLVLLGVLFFIYFFGFMAKVQHEKDLGIVIADTDSKFEPRQEATTHFTLYEGEKVKVLKREGAWVKIQRLDGKAGWVEQESIERI